MTTTKRPASHGRWRYIVAILSGAALLFGSPAAASGPGKPDAKPCANIVGGDFKYHVTEDAEEEILEQDPTPLSDKVTGSFTGAVQLQRPLCAGTTLTLYLTRLVKETDGSGELQWVYTSDKVELVEVGPAATDSVSFQATFSFEVNGEWKANGEEPSSEPFHGVAFYAETSSDSAVLDRAPDAGDVKLGSGGGGLGSFFW